MKPSRSFLSGVLVGVVLAGLAVFCSLAYSLLPLGDTLLCAGLTVAAASFAHLSVEPVIGKRWNRGWTAAAVVAVGAVLVVFWLSLPVGKAMAGLICFVASASVLSSRVRTFGSSEFDPAGA